MSAVPTPKTPPPGWFPKPPLTLTRAAVRTDVEKITPETAQLWLDTKNQINRNIRLKVAESYAEQMKAGSFPNTGEPIIFDWDDQIVSGQHRLLAVVMSGVTLTMVVVRGVDPRVRDVVDTGVKRTLADTLKLHGEVDCHALANGIGWLWRYQNGRMRWPQVRPSNHTSLALLEEHPLLRDAVRVGHRVRRACGGSAGMYGAMVYLFEGIDPVSANLFVEDLVRGERLEPGDPAFAFRRAMANTRPNHKPEAHYVAALLVKAWNAYRSGRRVQTLVWRPASGEPFPEAK